MAAQPTPPYVADSLGYQAQAINKSTVGYDSISYAPGPPQYQYGQPQPAVPPPAYKNTFTPNNTVRLVTKLLLALGIYSLRIIYC